MSAVVSQLQNVLTSPYSGESPEIGSIGRLYDLLVQAGIDTPVTGNQNGSYVTMKSNQGLVFGAATILSGLSLSQVLTDIQ